MPANVESSSIAYAVYNSGDVTINIPSGTVQGDLLLCYFLTFTEAGYGTPTHEPPAGWTKVIERTSDIYFSGAVIGAIYYKIATNSEPSTYVWGNSLSTRTFGNVVMLRISGVDTSNPIHTSASTNTISPASNYIFPSVTLSSPNKLLAIFGGLANTPTAGQWPLAVPTDFTRHSYISDSGNGIHFGSASKMQTTSGVTGTFTVPFNDFENLAQGFTVAINSMPIKSYSYSYIIG